jgi:hypothetical protein
MLVMVSLCLNPGAIALRGTNDNPKKISYLAQSQTDTGLNATAFGRTL